VAAFADFEARQHFQIRAFSGATNGQHARSSKPGSSLDHGSGGGARIHHFDIHP
jgi:hypothetical protein